ncbi:hypothetical protein DDE82_003945 [Stemphylium lycopersici]|nr:hypothetical protein DDE82_003945 [Stemphylium lycopersici]
MAETEEFKRAMRIAEAAGQKEEQRLDYNKHNLDV